MNYCGSLLEDLESPNLVGSFVVTTFRPPKASLIFINIAIFGEGGKKANVFEKTFDIFLAQMVSCLGRTYQG